MDENTAITMTDSSLEHTRIELKYGEVSLEADDPLISVKNEPVTVAVGSSEVRMVKHGLITINTDTNEVRVLRGSAEVQLSMETAVLKEGTWTKLAAPLKATKFDVRVYTDDLMAWSQKRSADISAANLYAAGTMKGGTKYGYTGGPWAGGWYYNSLFDTFTFIPGRGTIWNPWGYGFYSPGTIFGATGLSPVWFRTVVVNNGNSGKIPSPVILRPVANGSLVGTSARATRGEFNSAATAVANYHAASNGIRGGGFGGASGFSNSRISAPSYGGGAAASTAASFGGGAMARPSAPSGGGGGGGGGGHTGGGVRR
jgi:hypothetical protein